MARISLIIPTFNRPYFLKRCVESVRLAGSDVEVIVVDDGSQDQTASVCDQLRNIHYVRLENNRGVAGARNAGLRASTGHYIAFLDDDDLRLPASIDAQIALLDARPDAGMIYGRALYGDQNCNAKGGSYPDHCQQGDLFWDLMSWNFIPCPTVVFRRECLQRVGLLDEAANGVDDWDLWVRIAELYPVLATEEAVAIWRQPTATSGQFSFRAERMHRRARQLHRNKWLRLPRAMQAGDQRRRDSTRAFDERATQQLIWEAASRLKAGRPVDFVRLAFHMAYLYPFAAVRKTIRPSTWRFIFARPPKMQHGIAENKQ